MAKDYAKYQTRNSVVKKKSRTARGVWVIVLFLIIALIFGTMYLNKTHKKAIEEKFLLVLSKQQDKSNAKNKEFVPEKKSAILANTGSVNSEPKFDFYTILPKEQVSVSRQSLSPNANIKYFLQAGVMTNVDSANHLKSELALLGFEANVEQFNNGDSLAYRITVGPYFSEEDAKNEQKKLNDNKVQTIIIKK